MGVRAFAREKAGAVAEGVLALLYPPRCSVCLQCAQARSCRFLCEECLARVLQLEIPPLRYWPRPDALSREEALVECDLAAWYYEEALIALVPRLKYQQRPSLAKILAGLAARRTRAQLVSAGLEPAKAGAPGPVLVPVPLHPRRLRERGYNQSLLIAQAWAKDWNMEVLPRALRRTRFTPPQVKLSAAERLENVKGVFAPDRAEKIAGRTVLLVDDVITTGATMSECARALRQVGAGRVLAAALARTGEIFHFKK